jgi:hypothetical protein
MSSIENYNFKKDISNFVSNHKVLCFSTLGLAVIGYSIGKLAGRAISWICECLGTTKKTNDISLPRIHKRAPLSSSPSNSRRINVDPPKENGPRSTQALLLDAYRTLGEGWIMVPPRNEIEIGQPFRLAAGAVSFNRCGTWKIHISIRPDQMEQAIPIILEVLHAPDAPRVGFKMQTKANLNSGHQIGKEFAIIFDQVEEATPLSIERCLTRLWNRLYNAGIRPEEGLILTTQTMEAIEAAPEGTMPSEKDNLARGKFDRAIPCPLNCNFFHYRDESIVPMVDAGDLGDLPGIYTGAQIRELASTRPHLAHNPSEKPDPFLTIRIQQET